MTRCEWVEWDRADGDPIPCEEAATKKLLYTSPEGTMLMCEEHFSRELPLDDTYILGVVPL